MDHKNNQTTIKNKAKKILLLAREINPSLFKFLETALFRVYATTGALVHPLHLLMSILMFGALNA
jgi:hypothetical protein